MIPGFLAPQGPDFFAKTLVAFTFPRSCLAFSGNVYRGAPPLVGVAKKILAAGTKFSQTSTAGPLGVLAAYLAAATTKARDFDGGPLRGVVGNSGNGHHRSWRRRWRSPGVLAASLVAATTKVEDVDDGPLGVLAACSAMTTTDAGDIDGEPPRGCWQ
jgi:hypothetical protein